MTTRDRGVPEQFASLAGPDDGAGLQHVDIKTFDFLSLAIKGKPDFAVVHFNLGSSLAALNRIELRRAEEALQEFRED